MSINKESLNEIEDVNTKNSENNSNGNLEKKLTISNEIERETTDETNQDETVGETIGDAIEDVIIAEKKAFNGWKRFQKRMLEPATFSHVVSTSHKITEVEYEALQLEDANTYAQKFLIIKPSKFGRLYDKFTKLAGDTVTFIITCLLILVWAILGIVYGAPEDWQIIMQDVSSIQSYFSDSLLMRQQQNDYMDLLQLLAEIRSRSATYLEMFTSYFTSNEIRILNTEELDSVTKEVDEVLGEATKISADNWFDKISDVASKIFGSFYCVLFYWCGIIVWIGCGALPYLEFGNDWQLYINTATAVEITFVSMFIQNVRERHNKYLQKSLSLILYTDHQIEFNLRKVTGYEEPNVRHVIPAKKLSKGVKVIEYYAHVIGGGLGVAISTLVFIAWICVGHPMDFSANWWLIIGTYTGLIGFVDGFTLRSSYYRYFNYGFQNFEDIDEFENKLLNILYLPPISTRQPTWKERSFDYKASSVIGRILSSSWGVLFALCVTIMLIIIASAMKWSTTGQLICNTPTMIIEGFCLLVLLEGHNQNNTRLRILAHDCLTRKMFFKLYTEKLLESKECNNCC